MSPKIEFINHASVLLSNSKISILSDPWYSGTAFHDGWSLLYENKDKEIEDLLNRITHIWISHEHPDHFSIPFFKKYKNIIKDKKIQILFQESKDKRVVKFINSLSLDVDELKNKKEYVLDQNFKIICVKSGFYDSALICKINGIRVFNLNDCPINSATDIKKFNKRYGNCDILLTQFSYAAWKGGKENIIWRKKAAQEKLNTVLEQARIFSAKHVLPFASFVRFSNINNYYLNDCSNTPDKIIDKLSNNDFELIFLKPFEKQNLDYLTQNFSSLNFWRDIYNYNKNGKLIKYQVKSLENLKKSFLKYRNRIFNNNSYFLIWLLSRFNVMGVFQKINIKLKDLDICVQIDMLSEELFCGKYDPDILMDSDSLDFIFSNTFGFDTLTVNGCFEEMKKNGFAKLTKTLAIENLNNMGISIKLSILLRIDVIILFMRTLKRVLSKMSANVKVS